MMIEFLLTYKTNNFGDWEESDKFCDILSDYGLTVAYKYCYRFDNGAYTIVFVLIESHFIVHTYPENGLVFINLFSCKRNIDYNSLLFSDIARLIKGTIIKKDWVSRDVL